MGRRTIKTAQPAAKGDTGEDHYDYDPRRGGDRLGRPFFRRSGLGLPFSIRTADGHRQPEPARRQHRLGLVLRFQSHVATPPAGRIRSRRSRTRSWFRPSNSRPISCVRPNTAPALALRCTRWKAGTWLMRPRPVYGLQWHQQQEAEEGHRWVVDLLRSGNFADLEPFRASSNQS